MKPIITELNHSLADHLVLYQKLRHYHWTVRGPEFFALHAQFESLYTAAAADGDAIAERVLALGARPLATLVHAVELARLEEDPEPRGAHDMVRNIAADLTTVLKAQRKLAAAASDAGDVATANLIDGMADRHEKTIWMLRAFLGEPARG